METSRDRVLKAIEHRQPETTPIHLMGPEGIEAWLVRFGAKDIMDLREKMGLDIQEVRPVYFGPNTQPVGTSGALRRMWGPWMEAKATATGAEATLWPRPRPWPISSDSPGPARRTSITRSCPEC